MLITSLALLALAGDLDFEAAARSWLERHEVEAPAQPAQLPLDELFDRHFGRIRLGLFDARFPASAFDDKRDFESAQTACLALIDGQIRWLEWLADGDLETGPDVAAAMQDFAALREWVDDWKRKSLGRSFEDAGPDLIATADEEHAALIARLADWMDRGGPVGLGREPWPQKVFLMSNREEFVEIACVIGWASPDLRSGFWMDGLWGWTQFYFYDKKFYALQFARAPFSGDYTAGDPMKRFNKTGLEQQVAQLAMNALFDNYYYDKMSPDLGSGLASNLVIDVWGEVDTRTDGDLRARTTQAQEVFVPGAANDGFLGTNHADGRFRAPDQGAGRFVKPLRAAQKAGAKGARNKADKFRAFELVSDEEKDDFIFRAPVFDPSAAEQPQPGPEFQGDKLEFLRAYRVCFLYWLREHSADKPSTSRAQFARLFAELREKTFGEACREAFGASLSSPDLGNSTLEGKFLRWLAKK